MAQAPKKTNKKVAVQLNFSELDDLFLNAKGKALRNLRKKMDKYRDLDKNIRKGDVAAPNQQQKEQVASLPALQTEIEDLEALCKLYMQSNPDYLNKKDAAPALGEADIAKACVDSLALAGQVQTLSALLAEDESLLESSEAERASLSAVAALYTAMA